MTVSLIELLQLLPVVLPLLAVATIDRNGFDTGFEPDDEPMMGDWSVRGAAWREPGLS